jgi:hypothetical protein
MSAKAVIRKFGGIRKLARILGHEHPTTVQGWAKRDLIPAHRQREVLDAAKAQKLTIRAADLIPENARAA